MTDSFCIIYCDMSEIEPKTYAPDEDGVVLWNTELYLQNMQYPASMDGEPHLEPAASQLFGKYLDTPIAIRIIRLLRNNPQPTHYLRSSIVGRIFEEVCLPLVQRYVGQNFLILSPDETSKLFHLANPELEVLEFNQLNTAIQEISVPHYLMLQINPTCVSITGWGECKSGFFGNREKAQLHHFQPDSVARNLRIYSDHPGVGIGQILLGSKLPEVREDLPNLPVTMIPKPSIFYVMPGDSNPDLGEVTVIHTPFTRKEFYGFLDSLFLDCKI